MTDTWRNLRAFTQARIALGNVGAGLPTAALLDFQIAHAAARDAVLQAWACDKFAMQCASLQLPILKLQTAATDRSDYLQRPDKGRILHEDSRKILLTQQLNEIVDVVLIVSNGLSSTAVEAHALPFLQLLVPMLLQDGLQIGSLCLVENARVALSDEIGTLLAAKIAVIIVGERPGLTAADSLGVYMTYQPQPGKTDADRNCLSNIRPPEGLTYEAAVFKLHYLIKQAINRKLSGVELKDMSVLAVC